MTQNLAGRTVPKNMANSARFHPTCAWCSRSNDHVKYCPTVGKNLCWPRCPEEGGGR